MPTWNPALVTGHPTIDEQHQELFARSDSLLEAMLQGRAADETAELVVFLGDYCRNHFAMEERLMAESSYPVTGLHRHAHRDFEHRFQEIEKTVTERGATAYVILQVKDLIRGWLVAHILTADAKLAEFLRAARAA